MKAGSGCEIPKFAVVFCHYASYTELNDVPFDASMLRSESPVKFQLGVGSLFSGFEKSLETMSSGEKSQFLIDPLYAYGPLGVPPRIPPSKYGILLFGRDASLDIVKN